MSRRAQLSSNWSPEFEGETGSWAERLAETIAKDVASGRLAPGDPLPTQRALARQLGITTGTVNRSYAIAQRSGLLVSEVGRGTFVAARAGAQIRSTALAPVGQGAVDLATNYPAGTEAEEALRKQISSLSRRQRICPDLLGVSPYEGRQKHRAGGAKWLRQLGLPAKREEVLLSTSVQHGLAAALSALTGPGDIVLTEELTSPGIKAVAAIHRLRLRTVASDRNGIIPDALAEACRKSDARVLYTMPTLHTPTTVTMPNDRRKAIAEVIRKRNVTAIEDDAWGFLADGSVLPLQAFAPDNVVYLTSMSKALAPGLRVGFIVAPQALQTSLVSCAGNVTWTAPLMAELVTQWIEDGTAGSIVKQRVQAARQRKLRAEKILGRAVWPSKIASFHLWLALSVPWRVTELIERAASEGILLASTDVFVPGRAAAPHAIRICTGTEADEGRVERALRKIAHILQTGPTGFSTGPL